MSSNGKEDFFLNDPTLPKFYLPGFVNGVEGQQVTGDGGQPTIIKRYLTGREFAIEYGPKMLPPGAKNVQLMSSGDEPALAARVQSKLRLGVSVTFSG
jgi:hypothetical protein